MLLDIGANGCFSGQDVLAIRWVFLQSYVMDSIETTNGLGENGVSKQQQYSG
jgi:hypothetical protein